MLHVFGSPGTLTKDCSAPSPSLEKLLTHDGNVGPFRVSGMR